MPGRHLSVSQLRLLLGCARQWRLQYLEGLRPPPTVDLVVGVVWHAAIEHHLGRRQRGEAADPAASAAALAAAWAREAARPRIDGRRETPESARRLTDRLFDAYVRDLAPLLTPVAVEQPFSVPIPGPDGWTFEGRIDAVADDGWLIDQKTSGTPYTDEQVDAGLQATAYLWAWRELHGTAPPGVAFHVAVKGAVVATQEIVTRRTPEQLDWFAGLLREAVRQVEAEALPPDPGYRWCPRCPAVWAARCMPWRARETPAPDATGPGAGGATAAGPLATAGDPPAEPTHRERTRMAERTAIEWTATVHPDGTVTPGSSWNPLRAAGPDGATTGWACVKVSPACSACYAERLNLLRGNGRPSLPGRHAPPVLDERALGQPASWRAPRRVFVCSMTDLFWEAVPDGWIARVLEAACAAPRHTYLLLTKRPDRLRRFFEAWLAERRLPTVPGHIWVGATVENQTQARRRLPELLAVPAAVRFVSAEPLLGPLALRAWLGRGEGDAGDPAVRWVITGGESGGTRTRRLVERAGAAASGAPARPGLCDRWRLRPRAADWLRAIRDQCLKTRTAFLRKQHGGPTPKAGGRALDGLVWHQYPDGSGFVRPAD